MKLSNAQACKRPNPLHLYQVTYSLVFMSSRNRRDYLEKNPFSRPFPGLIILINFPTAPQLSNLIKGVSISLPSTLCCSNSVYIGLRRFCLPSSMVYSNLFWILKQANINDTFVRAFCCCFEEEFPLPHLCSQVFLLDHLQVARSKERATLPLTKQKPH